MSTYQFDGGNYSGAHFGDSHITIGSHAYDPNFDFDRYTDSIRAKLQAEAARNIDLDLEQLVFQAGDELKVLTTEPVTLTGAIRGQRRVVVLGSSGSGKTSSLHNLIATGDADELRIFIELARYRRSEESDLDSILRLIADAVTDWSGSSLKPSNELLRRILLEKPVMLLLDGLNEVDAELRHLCLRAIKDLDHFPRCRVVLSTRVQNFVPLRDWALFRLRELTDEQIRVFLDLQADAATRDAVFDLLTIHDNPLLRLPLFLRFVIDIVRSNSTDERPLLGSRSGLVARYIQHLFHREEEKVRVTLDVESMRSILSGLALYLQGTGQSCTFAEAAAALGMPEEAARAPLSELVARGLLFTDNRYIRFWHQTLQEYFYASARRRECFQLRGARLGRKLRRLLSRTEEEDALAFMIAGATDAELRVMIEAAASASIALATRWADDLSMEGRQTGVVDVLFERFRRQLRRIAAYSRVTYDRQVGLKVVALLGLTILAAGMLIERNWPKGQPVLGFLQVSFGCVLALAALLTLHSLLSYPGHGPAAAIFGEGRNVTSGSLRQRYSDLAAFATALPLGSFELKELASGVNHPRREEDVTKLLQEGRGLYLSILLTAFSEDPRVPRLLEAAAIAGRGNVYSRIALDTLRRRALTRENERPRFELFATSIWKDSTVDWKFRRIAGRARAERDPAIRDALLFVRIKQWAMAVGVFWLAQAAAWVLCFWFLVSGWQVCGSDILHELWDLVIQNPSDLAVSLWGTYWVLWGVLSAFYIGTSMRRLGATSIPGCFDLDTWSSRLCMIVSFLASLTTGGGLGLAIYLLNRKRIEANIRGLDLDAVRAILKSMESTS